ncbi:MAG TPA: M14 family metallopeptidase [Pyrinomonadaceae bacterium]|nr:M14 family metallopeptidase [Pyrinomonadaceae bacterium]
MAQSTTPAAPPEWQTRAEKTDYRETPRYDETIAFARKLDDASPLIRYTTFGRSGEGRELPLLVAAAGNDFTPQAARRAGKAVILIQACIHAGESDGKDAGLALLRDIAVTKTRAGLLDRVVVLFIPIYNTDGHERFGPFNRINQNGPAEMGWRATSANLNLNRDYMKADAPETRAWLKLWAEWSPDLLVDCHVTDGADFRYNITYIYEHQQHAPAPVLAWMREAFDGGIFPATEGEGNLLAQYMTFRDNRDLMKGIDGFVMPPRFSTGYTTVRNRPGLTIETHMLKDYRSRVRGTYDLLRFTLEELNRNTEKLLSAVREADELTVKAGQNYDPARSYPLQIEITDKPRPFAFKGVESRTEMSDISGQERVVFGSKPVDMTLPFYDEGRVATAVAPPLYYVVPPQWKSVIEVLAAHGLRLQRLAAPATIGVETYRFTEVKFAPAPFEGRVLPSYKTNPVKERRTFPAGSVVVPVAQPAGFVAIHLLEPQAPDSFVAWGFFNAAFEQKEYGEDYVLEKLARELLAKDENLRREFEQRLKSDPQFASSPGARLNFFYERSPYWDREMNLYPVGRIVTPLNVSLTGF